MNRLSLTLLFALLALTACQKGADDQNAQQPAVEPGKNEAIAEKTVSPPTKTSDSSIETREVKYRTVKARLYRTEQSIEIRVPEDIDIEPNRLIEYKEGEDGQLYFVSLIPQ